MQQVRQREMCKRKAELSESQAFRKLPFLATHGFNLMIDSLQGDLWVD